MRNRGAALLLVAALGITGRGDAQVPAPVVQTVGQIEAVLATADLPGAHLGVVVMEAATGRVIYQHDADLALNPASNAKLLTAAAALSILGPDHRYATGLYGRVTGGAVDPLVLRGDGDPSLRTADLYVLARDLVALGVRQVRGIVVDDSAFGAQHLPPAFEQQPRESAPFRAAVGAVSVDDNALAVHVRPGPSVGAPAVVTADPPGYLDIESTLTTSASGAPAVSLSVTPAADGREHARLTGTFPLGASAATYRRRLDDPPRAAGEALRAALNASGIRVSGTVEVGTVALGRAALLVSHDSARLSTLLYELGKASNNFYAEMTLLAIAAAPVPEAPDEAITFARGAARVRAWVQRAGVDATGLTVRNGSGLYDANRVSARQVAGVLRAAWRDPGIRDEYIAQMAVPGEEGTLQHRMAIGGTARWVRAKTGTLDDVIALSGYVLAPDASRTLVFAFLANGVRGRGARARQVADEVVRSLVQAQIVAP